MPRTRAMPVPFKQAFHKGELSHGQALGVKASVKDKLFGSSKFTITLSCGPDIKGDKTDDIPFQLTWKEKEGLTFNSRLADKWGNPEPHPSNIEEEEEFYIRIEPQDGYITVNINGHKLADYQLRKGMSFINHVFIDGDLELHRVAWEGRYYMVPFEYPLDNFGAGHTVYITGRPEENAGKFDIELCGRDHDKNIPLLISVRFDKEGNKVVVRNTKRDGTWMDEERDGGFPFERNVDFDLIVDVRDEYFDLNLNGSPFVKYYHRIPPTGITKLEITGDVELKSVYV